MANPSQVVSSSNTVVKFASVPYGSRVIPDDLVEVAGARVLSPEFEDSTEGIDVYGDGVNKPVRKTSTTYSCGLEGLYLIGSDAAIALFNLSSNGALSREESYWEFAYSNGEVDTFFALALNYKEQAQNRSVKSFSVTLRAQTEVSRVGEFTAEDLAELEDLNARITAAEARTDALDGGSTGGSSGETPTPIAPGVYSIAQTLGYDDITSTDALNAVFDGQSNSEIMFAGGGFITLIDALNADPTAYIAVHEGSQGFRQGAGKWADGNELHEKLIDDLNIAVSTAKTDVVFAPHVWWQGEADSNNTGDANAYQSQLTTLIDNVRNETGLNLDWIIIYLNAAANYSQKAIVRSTQESMVAASARLHGFDTNPYTMLSDGRHYPTPTYEVIAQELYDQINAGDLLKRITVKSPRVADVSVVGTPAGSDSEYEISVVYESNTSSSLAAQTIPALTASVPGQTDTATVAPITSNISEGNIKTVRYRVTMPAGTTLGDATGDLIVRTGSGVLVDTQGNAQRTNSAVFRAPVSLPPQLLFSVNSDGNIPFNATITGSNPLPIFSFSDGSADEQSSFVSRVLPAGAQTVTCQLTASTTEVRSTTANLSAITGFSRLPALTEIRVDNNNLTEFPPELRDVQGVITGYNFANNQLAEIPSWISSAVSLRTLEISGNTTLTELPDEVVLCPTLINFYASGCSFTTLPNMATLAPLRKLRLQNNQLTFAALDGLLDELLQGNQGNPSELFISGNPGYASLNATKLASVRALGWAKGTDPN